MGGVTVTRYIPREHARAHQFCLPVCGSNFGIGLPVCVSNLAFGASPVSISISGVATGCAATAGATSAAAGGSVRFGGSGRKRQKVQITDGTRSSNIAMDCFALSLFVLSLLSLVSR